MHYCIHLITKELPSEEQIEEILKPFNDETVYGKSPANDDDWDEYIKTIEYPAFMYDYFVIGGRYGGALKLKIQFEEDDEYMWKYLSRPGEEREGRLFLSSLLHLIREKFERYIGSEDRWIGYLGDLTFVYVDGAKLKDIINKDELECYGFVDVDGTAYVRTHWNGKEHIDNPDFDNQYKKALEERSDCFLTVLDIHD